MATPMYKKTVCPLDCPDCCGIVAKIVDGRVVALQGDPDHPYTGGFICRKMKRYPERLYSKDRILYPMIRIGDKGEGRFRRISWDEAMALMVERFSKIIEEHGGEAILPYSYAGNMGLLSRNGGHPLFNKLGMSRLLGTICSAAAGAGWDFQCGDIPGCPPENCLHSELIVCWGINARVTNVHFWRYVAEARKSGARLAVIDPYRNETGRCADHYIAVRPGGDVPLALGVMKQLLEDEGYDKGFVANQTTGFAEFANSVRRLSWRELETDSGCGRPQIKQLAALFCAHPRTFIRMGIGMTRNSRGGMAIRAVASLAAMLGLFSGGPGRGVLLTSRGFRGDSSLITRPDLAPKELRTINMIELGAALNNLSPPVKALIIYNTNPVSVNPDGSMVRKGLCRNDLFTVVHEQVMTPTAKFADLLLPATTFLENRDLYTGYGQFYLKVTSRAIEPMGEAKSNFELWREVAEYLGLGTPYTASIEDRLRPYLATLDGLAKDSTIEEVLAGKLVRSTYSCADGDVLGRVDSKFHFISDALTCHPSAASLTARGESGDGDLQGKFPFHLIVPPHPDLLNSTFGERYPGKVGEVLIHPDDAEPLGIVNGSPVTISNLRGATTRLARISEDTRPGVLVAEGIFWPAQKESWGINEVTSQKLTDMGGGATLHESLVTVAPA